MSEQILIIGTGLIGGSMGLALRTNGMHRVTGYDVDHATARAALDAGAIDTVANDIAAGTKDADIIVIATPVGAILSTIEAVSLSAKPGAVVTDVGSTKAAVVDAAERLLEPDRAFVGGHPMAGTEGEGIAAAHAELFRGAPWILTPTERTDSGAYARINALVTGIGARTLALDPTEHDGLVARVSHLPYAVATTLMALTGEAEDPRVFNAAAGSFRDITRTAGTNPRIWHDILSTNRAAVAKEIDRLIAKLSDFRAALDQDDMQRIDAQIENARSARKRLPIKGEREPAQPVTVDVTIPDRAGVLAEVTTAIGEAGINIEDLSMLHTAAGGVLRLVIDGRPAAAKAMSMLATRGIRSAMVEER